MTGSPPFPGSTAGKGWTIEGSRDEYRGLRVVANENVADGPPRQVDVVPQAFDVRFLRTVAKARDESTTRRNVRTFASDGRSSLETHFLGAAGEWASAVFTGHYWDAFKENPAEIAYDVGRHFGYEVRSTAKQAEYGLAYNPSSPKDRAHAQTPYIFARVRVSRDPSPIPDSVPYILDDVRLVGWSFGIDVERRGTPVAGRHGRPFHLLPAAQLYPLEMLPNATPWLPQVIFRARRTSVDG